MTQYVYVIEAQMGLIKIGHSHAPEQRLVTVRSHSPVKVRLLAYWPAARFNERELHARLVAHRSHGEWFRVEGEVLDFLLEVRGRGVATLERWEDITFADGETHKERVSALLSLRAKQRWADPRNRWEAAKQRAWRKAWSAIRANGPVGAQKYEEFSIRFDEEYRAANPPPTTAPRPTPAPETEADAA